MCGVCFSIYWYQSFIFSSGNYDSMFLMGFLDHYRYVILVSARDFTIVFA